MHFNLHQSLHPYIFNQEFKKRKKEKMAAVADVCMGELAKLSEKVRARNPFSLKFSKREATHKVGETNESKDAKARCEDAMAETTVLLLIDRWCAPC
ncbi:hypothetical protein ACP275_02G028400 [Erythranthe tilingii]